MTTSQNNINSKILTSTCFSNCWSLYSCSHLTRHSHPIPFEPNKNIINFQTGREISIFSPFFCGPFLCLSLPLPRPVAASWPWFCCWTENKKHSNLFQFPIPMFLTFSFCSLYWSACLLSSSSCIISSLIFFSSFLLPLAASILSWASALSCSSRLLTLDSRAAEMSGD